MRLTSRFLIGVMLVSALPRAGRAQQEEITVDSRPTDAGIRGWLMRDDPRLVAWGAYFAREREDDGEATLLLRQVDRWESSEAMHDRRDAMSEVLDALIERRETVSPERLGVLTETFPVQAAILASRLPVAEATPLLVGWYGDGVGSLNSALPRVAAMMLAKAPPAGFAASVVSLSEERLFVSVRDGADGLGGGGGSSCCGDSVGRLAAKGWPPLFAYALEENVQLLTAKEQAGDSLVESGGDRITYRRSRTDQGSGSCRFPRALDAATRQQLIAEMLGIRVEAMAWRDTEPESIQWTGDAQYRERLREIVRTHEERLEETVVALVAKGFVTQGEKGRIRPRLSVEILDSRTLNRSRLPVVVPRDSRTAILVRAAED